MSESLTADQRRELVELTTRAAAAFRQMDVSDRTAGGIALPTIMAAEHARFLQTLADTLEYLDRKLTLTNDMMGTEHELNVRYRDVLATYARSDCDCDLCIVAHALNTGRAPEQPPTASLDAEVRDEEGILYGTVRDLLEAHRVWMDGAMYGALGIVQGFLYNEGINRPYTEKHAPAGHDDPSLYGTLIQKIVQDALAGEDPSRTPGAMPEPFAVSEGSEHPAGGNAGEATASPARGVRERIELNDDGTLDEIVGHYGHLEQMDDNLWFVCIGPYALSLGSESPITAQPHEGETWDEAIALRAQRGATP